MASSNGKETPFGRVLHRSYETTYIPEVSLEYMIITWEFFVDQGILFLLFTTYMSC